ncbi:RNA polymerase sigma factor [Bradyrhizobium diazoefficiens]|uniref:RNA polymerase sigma factor n=1 Tax=Bradyrhizobium diazoefficiens TaxID=1355477 RepID=UPI0034768C27
MKTGAKTPEEPPSPSDLEGWRNVSAANGLRRLRPEDIVAAIQHVGPHGDQRLLAALITHVSEQLLRIIKRLVGKNHRNEGEDIIWRAHHQLIVAVLKPNSKDGQALCKSFRKCVEFRVADAIRAERKYAYRNQPFKTQPGVADDGEDTVETIESPEEGSEQAAEVQQLLNRIPDPRKREAFRLHMDGCPLSPGIGTTSIAEQLGISAKTAGDWIAETKALLKIEIGAAHD